MTFDFSVVLDFRHALFLGLLVTLKLTAICLILGTILGFLVALARTSGNKVLFVISTAYVTVFRGTPVLIQLFWIFFCLPLLLGIEMSNAASAVLSLTLFMGAVTSETFRASFNFVGKDQYDASVALGLPYRVQVVNVVLPQALLRSVPTLLSNCTSLFKESALVSTVGMTDLLFVSQNIANRTGHPVEILTAAALIYFAIAFPITRAVTRLESRTLARLAM